MSYTVDSLLLDRILTERAYVVSEVKSISNGGSFNIHLENPSNSGLICLVLGIICRTKGGATINVHDRFSTLTGGTQFQIQNALLDTGAEDDEGPFDALRDVTFTETSTHASAVLGGTGGNAQIGGRSDYPVLAIEPGREIVVEIENDISSTNKATITILFVEVNHQN